jgi:acetoin utilization protein AcuB
MLVKDRMSVHPLTISEDESIFGAHRYMQEQNIRHLPVVDRAGRMVGVVTEDDLLKAEPSGVTLLSVWEINSLLTKVKVKDVMVRAVITTTEDTPIEEAAHLMHHHRIGCLPVMRDAKLVGIITESDIFCTFMELFSAREKGLRITLEIPDTEGQLAKVAQAIADQGGYIAACGTFMSEDPTKWGLVLKVKNVERDILTTALASIEGERTLDVREV